LRRHELQVAVHASSKARPRVGRSAEALRNEQVKHLLVKHTNDRQGQLDPVEGEQLRHGKLQ
jgi:hypothetical protein